MLTCREQVQERYIQRCSATHFQTLKLVKGSFHCVQLPLRFCALGNKGFS